MDAKKCDRCGSYYEEKSNIGDDIYDARIEVVTLDASTNYYSKKKYDLCPVCTLRLQRFLLNENINTVDILIEKPDKTLSESLEEKLALPVEGAPNGPATDCKYCGVCVNGREDIRSCNNPFIMSHTLCTYKCTKFEQKEEEK
jgi:hypothetical protein